MLASREFVWRLLITLIGADVGAALVGNADRSCYHHMISIEPRGAHLNWPWEWHVNAICDMAGAGRAAQADKIG